MFCRCFRGTFSVIAEKIQIDVSLSSSSLFEGHSIAKVYGDMWKSTKNDNIDQMEMENVNQ